MKQPLKTEFVAQKSVPEAESEPRWHTLIAVLSVGAMSAALPGSVAVVPSSVLIGVIALLLVPLITTHYAGKHDLNQILGYILNGALTVFLLADIGLLMVAMIEKKEPPLSLLSSAVLLWVTNVVIFALWYWRLDAGGPHQRDRRAGHTKGAFLFPQMTLDEDAKRETGQENWSPDFIDYLFLAFNTSTALSPTDAPILSRWAKALMMVQALQSLGIVVLIAARAVNVL